MFGHALSFAAGVVTGWTARSVFGSTRELAVRALALTLGARESLRRTAAEQVEWWEDMVAEAKSRIANGHAERAAGERAAGEPEHTNGSFSGTAH